MGPRMILSGLIVVLIVLSAAKTKYRKVGRNTVKVNVESERSRRTTSKKSVLL